MFDYIRSLPEAHDEVYDLMMDRQKIAKVTKVIYPWNCTECMRRNPPGEAVVLYEGRTCLALLCAKHKLPDGFQKESSDDRQKDRDPDSRNNKNHTVH